MSLVIPDVSARKLYEYRISGKSPDEVGGNYGRALRVLQELGVERRSDMTYPEFVDAVRNAIPENLRKAFTIAYSLVSSIGKVTPDSLYSVARRLKRVGVRKVTLGFLLGLLKGVKIPGPARIPTGSYDEDAVAVTLHELGGIAKIRDIVGRLEKKGYTNPREMIIDSFLNGKFYPIPAGKRSPTIPQLRGDVLKIALSKGEVAERSETGVKISVPKEKLDDSELKIFGNAANALPYVTERDADYLVEVDLSDTIRVISVRLL